jgi:hypothetical protein
VGAKYLVSLELFVRACANLRIDEDGRLKLRATEAVDLSEAKGAERANRDF